MVPLRVVRKLQDEGAHCDLILGTLTGQLGDPSGQEKTRPILSQEETLANADALTTLALKILDPHKTTPWQNHSFVADMSVPAFLCDLVSKFTVSALMARDAFRKRDTLRMHELLVPLLQAWDSVKVKAELEVGGNDQLFNFQITRDLQTAHGQTPQTCLLTPIINGTDGRKMSKSFNNCIWLDDSPSDVFGKTMSIPDEQISQWVTLLTDLEDIPSHPMKAKKALAFDITQQLHGTHAATEAQTAFEHTIQQKQAPHELTPLKQDTLLNVVSALRGCSKSQARKLLQNAVKVDGVKTHDPHTTPHVGATIQAGKRSWGIIVTNT